MPIPSDYIEQVYAGILGKVIGVYLGQPMEGWQYDRIMRELGEIRYYVHERFNRLLVVTDDDIAGTLTFPRAMADYGYPMDLRPEQIANTWLNYIIEGRTIFWWGGVGYSTEHTVYRHLKTGDAAHEKRFDCIERKDCGRADRCTDLYRRLGHAGAR